MAAEASIDEELEGSAIVGGYPAGRVAGDHAAVRVATRMTSSTCSGHVEVGGDVAQGVAGQEAVDEILDACAGAGDEREAERDLRVHDHVGLGVARELDLRRPAVGAVGDALEVVADEVGELVLASADDDQVEDVLLVALLGVVEQDLGAVGEQALGGERVLDPDLARRTSTAGRMRCSGTPARRKAESTYASANPMNGTVASGRGAGRR